jgi:glucosamine--fructose-6-phosphate aminotransferase (isomerizing)
MINLFLRRHLSVNKNDFRNPLGDQVFSLPDLVDEQLERCFDMEKLNNVFSMAEIFDGRKVIMTGCGDSYTAAGAMKNVMVNCAGIFGSVEVLDPMQFTRFTTKEQVGIGEPNSPFVIVISASGGSARIAEMLEKANTIGAFSILMTNKAESRSTVVAKRVYFLDTPKMKNDTPGLRSYFASLLGIIALSVRMGHVKGVLPPTAVSDWKKAVSDYVHSYGDAFEKMSDQMFELAKTWKDFERFDFIGDDVQLFSALFGMEKFYECCGVLANYDDSEDWGHIDYFIKNPETVGTVIMADKNSPSFNRVIETVEAALSIGRPTLVVTNANKEDIPEGANVVKLPDTPEGYDELITLMDYAPISLLAGYCAALGGRKYFNTYDPLTLEKVVDGESFNYVTTGSSKIEIHI